MNEGRVILERLSILRLTRIAHDARLLFVHMSVGLQISQVSLDICVYRRRKVE